MYGLKVYIKPEDILEKLSEEDKARFNQCVFYDIQKMMDGSIEIDCRLFNDQHSYAESKCRYRYCDDRKIKLQ